MKSFRILAISFFLVAMSDTGFAQQIPETGRLFAGAIYRYSFIEQAKSWFGCSRKQPTWLDKSADEVVNRGTYWAVMLDGSKIYVTAAHVLGLNTKPTEIAGVKLDNQNGKLLSVTGRAYMGTLAYTVQEIGQVSSLDDVAFLRPHEKNILDKVNEITLATKAPASGERVSVVGFPGTPYQQLTEMLVTSVHETEGFMVLNQPVDPGYSGGVVLNSSGQAYGVVVNTDQQSRQTTVIRLTPADLRQIQWSQASAVLSRKFN